VAKQAKTASASRRLTGAFALGALSAGAAIGLAAPASADSAGYLAAVAPRYAYMSDSQLMSAGNQACSNARSGVPASDSTIKISKGMGISTSAAYEIVINAMNHLGC
jgi:hypothetical protein